MPLLRVGALPAEELAAAAEFHRRVLPQAEALLATVAPGGEPLTLVFAPADHTHRDWRTAAVRGLARSHAPRRVNALAGEDEAAIAAATRYLAAAPGVTGQYLPLDGNGAGAVLSIES